MTWCSEYSAVPRCLLARSAIRCRSVDRFAGFSVPSRVSLQRFSPRGASLPSVGSQRARFPDLTGTMKALRLPTPHPGRFWFATGFRAALRGSCSPKRSRADGGAARAWAVWSAGGPVPAGVRVDGVGSHRFPGDPSRTFALLQDPGRISGPSPKRSHRCCPRAQHGEGFSGHMISRLPQGFSTRCLRFARDVAAARARLASDWLVGLCWEGVEPSGSRRKVSERSHVVLLPRAYPVASWFQVSLRG